MLQPFLLTALWPHLPDDGYGKCVEGSSNTRWSRLVLMAQPRFTGFISLPGHCDRDCLRKRERNNVWT